MLISFLSKEKKHDGHMQDPKVADDFLKNYSWTRPRSPHLTPRELQASFSKVPPMLFGSEVDTALFLKVCKAGEKWGAMEGKVPRKQRDTFRLVFLFSSTF